MIIEVGAKLVHKTDPNLSLIVSDIRDKTIILTVRGEVIALHKTYVIANFKEVK